ncbi:MAG TPA: secretion system protein E [Verrucomicrobia bacterium]|nr:MAG: secretion system protein E [Lentisphaerae bacterium GWF2_57_35]HBA85858.1 secretion system protein E [Verrucomicrobiota bacterium]
MDTASLGEKVIDILIKRRAINPEILQEVKEGAKASGIRLEKMLVQKNLVAGADMALALAEYLNMPPISLAHFTPDNQLLDLVPRETLTRHMMVPIARIGNMLTVALGDPFDVVGLEELHALAGLDVVPVVAPEKELTDLLQRFTKEPTQGLEDILKDVSDSDVELGHEEKEDVSLDEMLESAEDAPVIRIVNSIMVEAIRRRASDVHLEPMERSLRLRYRIDGILYESPSPPKSLQSAIISRIKIMSNLNIAERRVPQDGRFKIKALGKEADIRVSILPTVHGEKIVMRILDKSALAPNLSALGLDQKAYENLKYSIDQPHGMILVTGPTGSGKTTTLYSALQELNTTDVNIITVEDPVEYQLVGINQVQAHSEVGLTFAAGLRSILRQDPDIVMVGEIRDGETASIAVQAALTGHLVLSTLHTNDAAGAIARLLYMGIEAFLLSSSLIMTQAQRLYRKLCPACKKQRELPSEILRLNKIDPEIFSGATLYEAHGCPKCGNTGYKGRGALMEILMVGDEVKALMLKEASSGEIRDVAVKNGMLTLRDVGLLRVRDGVTSVEEVLLVTSGE